MQITKEFLKEKEACSAGFKWFLENFKADDGGEYNEVLGALSKDKKLNWIHWLVDAVGKEEKILDLNDVYMNTGDRNTGDMNTGNMNTGDMNTGDRNTGDWNTGDWNTGNMNTGDWNTGNRNTGDLNTGYMNTGYMNTGNMNTGDWNKTNYSSGVFCTEEPKAIIFDKLSDMKLSEWFGCEARYILMRIQTINWIYTDNMTDQEKELHPEHETTGGFLKVISKVEAAEKWLSTLTESEKQCIRDIPNYDADKFEQIVGVRI